MDIMKKIIITLIVIFIFIVLINLDSDDVEDNEGRMHYTWDMDEDGGNDCENDGSCDHTVDYSKPRYVIEGVEDKIVFDKRSQKWVDKFGICHTCTPKNGFRKDGTIEKI